MVLFLPACGPTNEKQAEQAAASSGARPPSLLLITWDTVRADSTGLENERSHTPNLRRLAETGTWFRRAYSTIPLTGPSHASMFSGLDPMALNLFENGRNLPQDVPVLSEVLLKIGYRTAAYVSAYPLNSRYGFSRGFQTFDGPESGERPSRQTVDLAIGWLTQDLAKELSEPLFLWVHLYDAHAPYAPEPPWSERFSDHPYLGEIAAMDEQTGRLLEAFDRQAPGGVVILTADHGEGLADHGEEEHGVLLFEECIRVPLVVRAAVQQGEVVLHPVSLQDLAPTALALLQINLKGAMEPGFPWFGERREQVQAYSLQPWLNYGWAPQAAIVRDHHKLLYDGEVLAFDLSEDSAEMAAQTLKQVPAWAQAAVESLHHKVETGANSSPSLSPAEQELLASLGYSSGGSGTRQLLQALQAPRKQIKLLAVMDRASHAFTAGRYKEALLLYESLASKDPGNPSIPLRRAVIHSHLQQFSEADEQFQQAMALVANPADVLHFWGLSQLDRGDLIQAEAMTSAALRHNASHIQAWLVSARIAARQDDKLKEEHALIQAVKLDDHHCQAFERIGLLRMAQGDSGGAVEYFQRAWQQGAASFQAHLEWGVCLMDLGRLEEASIPLQREPASSPRYPMAAFKRAQIAKSRGDGDWPQLVEQAWAFADETTTPLLQRAFPR
jgi:Tfp pilus assembly protein PilF